MKDVRRRPVELPAVLIVGFFICSHTCSGLGNQLIIIRLRSEVGAYTARDCFSGRCML